ncbi:rhomboid family intramembrane serine protease [Oceaniovalibus sp. ACAM 378]|uniref:rhomboid family intramembrane serine protease n=1 Tax=Oceaniovalibus sp. ACAM 378 TaxID=2599923 RepID=UPI0011D42658|nr:rhomboid family intramembrane serine protease [Oceaniovalibus sp. ACAM 378]TYB87609.1 rhomboid family intramembrane serine protease [Oceaniovalibus sp. ACAM 378]
MNTDRNAPPFNPIPPVVLGLAVAIVLIELVFQAGARGFAGGAGGVGWRIAAFNDYAFLPELFDRAIATGDWGNNAPLRMVSYLFLHQGFSHLIFVVVFLLALGKFVGEMFHPLAVLAIFFGAGAVGAATYGLVLDDPVALIGGYPGVYGLIGGYTFILWTGLGAMQQNRGKAFILIGFLMAFQLLFGLLFGGGNYWVAELGGFVAGFLLSFAVSPGGVARLLGKVRER